MKRFFQIVMMVTLTALAASCSRYSYETVKGDPTGARIYTLDNGLKIYTIVNKDEPRIDAHIAVKNSFLCLHFKIFGSIDSETTMERG